MKQAIFEARTALHDFAAGREMSCTTVRRQLSDGDGRTARSRRLRAHLRTCDACREFRAELRTRRSELTAHRSRAPGSHGGRGAGVRDRPAVGGGGLLAALIGGSGISKTVAVGAATVTAGAGAATLTAVVPEVREPRPLRACRPRPRQHRAGAASRPGGAAVAAVPDEAEHDGAAATSGDLADTAPTGGSRGDGRTTSGSRGGTRDRPAARTVRTSGPSAASTTKASATMTSRIVGRGERDDDESESSGRGGRDDDDDESHSSGRGSGGDDDESESSGRGSDDESRSSGPATTTAAKRLIPSPSPSPRPRTTRIRSRRRSALDLAPEPRGARGRRARRLD